MPLPVGITSKKRPVGSPPKVPNCSHGLALECLVSADLSQRTSDTARTSFRRLTHWFWDDATELHSSRGGICLARAHLTPRRLAPGGPEIDPRNLRRRLRRDAVEADGQRVECAVCSGEIDDPFALVANPLEVGGLEVAAFWMMLHRRRQESGIRRPRKAFAPRRLGSSTWRSKTPERSSNPKGSGRAHSLRSRRTSAAYRITEWTNYDCPRAGLRNTSRRCHDAYASAGALYGT